MRKKTQVSIRLEWIAAMAHLASEVRHEVLDAVIAYLTDGTVADVLQEGAAAFGSIRDDIDRREAKRAEQRAKRAARAAEKAERERAAHTETPIPGYLPALPPADLEERVARCPLVRMAVGYAERCEEFRYFDRTLLLELALQVSDWWRSHPSERLPSFSRMREEFRTRFLGIVSPSCGAITRERWLSHMAPYTDYPANAS